MQSSIYFHQLINLFLRFHCLIHVFFLYPQCIQLSNSRRNFARLDIFFSELREEHIIQSEAYSVADLLSKLHVSHSNMYPFFSFSKLCALQTEDGILVFETGKSVFEYFFEATPGGRRPRGSFTVS